jgi:hypothetical protein
MTVNFGFRLDMRHLLPWWAAGVGEKAAIPQKTDLEWYTKGHSGMGEPCGLINDLVFLELVSNGTV